MSAFNVGLVGCGMIRSRYLKACGESRWVNVVACADLVSERAARACAEYRAEGWGDPAPATFDELLERDDIQLILNLTNPKAHHPLNLRALRAGKHVYSEKPLAITNEQGRELLDAAEASGVRLGCAPDTFIGAGHQTARQALDRGDIGAPTAAALFFVGGGPDGYHEDPEFFFEEGGGPLQDNGVYALTVAVAILGPVRRVMAFTKKTWEERKILSKKKYGQMMPVDVPTHISASLEFANGTLGTFISSFDIKGGNNLPFFDIYGTEGTLTVPNPNQFITEPTVRTVADTAAGWQPVALSHGYTGESRGIGAADLAAAVINGRPPRAGGELAYHILEVSNALYESGRTARAADVSGTVERPLPMPEGLTTDIMD